MRKILFTQIYLICILVNGFAAENYNIRTDGYYYNTGEFGSITRIHFSNQNRITMDEYYAGVKIGRYTVVSEYGIPYINIVWNDNSRDKYLLLFYESNRYIVLYNSDSEPTFVGEYMSESQRSEREWAGGTIFYRYEKIAATSSLREDDIVYSPDNILNLSIGRPWVEGVPGQGIGEKLTFSAISNQSGTLYISIGFVSFTRPNLFRFNSRPSKIKVSCGNYFFIVDLNDTPHFQAVTLPTPWNNAERIDKNDRTETFMNINTLEIEIIDVYPGTRWADTCINAILFSFFQ